MAEPVIRVEGLSKRYRIGARNQLHDRFREALVSWLRQPLANYRQLRRLTRFAEGVDEVDVIWALRDVSFEVAQGEVIGLIGRNGAGKSTMLKILSRLSAPTFGRAVIRGRVSSLLEVGTGFHDDLTGRQNVYLSGTILGMKKLEIDAKFERIAAFSEVEAFLDTPVKRYSSGMRVRLAFSVAAHLDPEIMLLDEVLSVGDAAFQEKSLNKIREIVTSGRTVIVVSHSMDSIRKLCKRAILLQSGRIVRDGPVEEVIQQYVGAAPAQQGVERVWNVAKDAPGIEGARVHAIRLHQEGTGPVEQVDIARDLLVEVVYWSLAAATPINVAIMLADKHGTPIVASVNRPSNDTSDEPWSGRPHPVGLFRATCRIPAFLLNDRAYLLKVALGLAGPMKLVSHAKHYLDQTTLAFSVADTQEINPDNRGQWLGSLRPNLTWHTRQLE